MTVRLVVSEIFKDDNQGLDSSEPFLFVLPAAGRRALLSLSELLTWEATWIEVDPASGRQIRTPLTDRQQAIIDATRDGLMEFEQVNLITSKLDELITALDDLGQTVNVSSVCCDQIQAGTTPPAVTPDDYPMPGSGQEPPGYPNPGGYDADLCASMNGILWMYYRFLRFLKNVDAFSILAGLIVAGLAALIPTPITTPIGTISFVAIAGVLGKALATGVLSVISDGADAAMNTIETYKQDIICSTYASTSNLHDAMIALIDRLQSDIKDAMLTAGVPADMADRLSKFIDDVAGAVAHIVDRLPELASEWSQGPTGWAVDCSCQGEMLTLTIDPLDPAWVLAGNYIVDQQNGYVELRRHGASTGGESSMTLSLAAIRAALGYTDPLYALDAEIEGICYVDPCSYRTVYLQAQFSLYDAPGPPTGTAVWRGTHNNVCITNTGTAGCFPAGTEEPFSIAAMTVPNDPYGAAPNGFRLTTYRPIASGGDSACWGWFRITSVKIKFCKQPLVNGQCA